MWQFQRKPEQSTRHLVAEKFRFSLETGRACIEICPCWNLQITRLDEGDLISLGIGYREELSCWNSLNRPGSNALLLKYRELVGEIAHHDDNEGAITPMLIMIQLESATLTQ